MMRLLITMNYLLNKLSSHKIFKKILKIKIIKLLLDNHNIKKKKKLNIFHLFKKFRIDLDNIP